MNDVLGIILGGGQGSRLFPLTHARSKPAVPIGGKYRLIDVPVSNCLHADLRRIFVLTQFNSASLNRHVGQTYRMDLFANGFVEILAAEQTPDNPNWFQGTADAVRQAARHFARYDADYYLILAGDLLLDLLHSSGHTDFGREIIPAALETHHVHSHLFRGYWADVGTVDSFYEANIQLTRRGAPFTFYDPRRPIYTHPRFLPGSRISDSTMRDIIVAEGCYLDRCAIEESVVGIRTTIQPGAEVRRSVLLGAD